MIRGHHQGAGFVMSLHHCPLLYTFVCMPIFLLPCAAPCSLPWRVTFGAACQSPPRTCFAGC